jgi:hypothetical protein
LGVAEAILQRKKRVSYRRVACEQARDVSRRFGREDRIRLRGIDAKGEVVGSEVGWVGSRERGGKGTVQEEPNTHG